MAQAVEIRLQNWAKLQRAVNPRMMAHPVNNMFDRATTALQKNVLERTPEDTGTLKNSIVRQVGTQKPYARDAIVGSRLEYAPYVEFGRRPGRMPPVSVIEAWALRRGMRPGSGFYIARAIGRRGTRPANMFSDGLDASITELEVIVRIFGDELVEAMKRA